MPSISTILFDLDGTLIDSRADLVAAVNHSLTSLGRIRKSSEEILPHVGNGLKTLLERVLLQSDDKTIGAATSAFHDYYLEHCIDDTVLYDDVREVLIQLSQRTKLGVVTNKPVVFAKKILRELKIHDVMSLLYGGDSFPERKPHPRPIREAIRELSASAETSMIVGDGHQDLQAGQAAGIRTCLARFGYGYDPQLLKLKPDFVIDRFIQLKEIVK